jgi:hypothetical protein
VEDELKDLVGHDCITNVLYHAPLSCLYQGPILVFHVSHHPRVGLVLLGIR